MATFLRDKKPKNVQQSSGLVAGVSVIGALLATSCCILPLVLVTLGISGAWMGNLTAMEPYQGYFAAGTMAALGLGYWQVYFKPRIACPEGSYCASYKSTRIIRMALWLATLLILIEATVDYWAPLLY